MMVVGGVCLLIAFAVSGGLLLARAVTNPSGGSMRKRKEDGRLIIRGKGGVTIPMDFVPKKVFVAFVYPEARYIACSPVPSDVLRYKVTRVDEDCDDTNEGLLVIEWDVAGVREIMWEAKNNLG